MFVSYITSLTKRTQILIRLHRNLDNILLLRCPSIMSLANLFLPPRSNILFLISPLLEHEDYLPQTRSRNYNSLIKS